MLKSDKIDKRMLTTTKTLARKLEAKKLDRDDSPIEDDFVELPFQTPLKPHK